MPRGASPEREREYNELVSQFKHEGRYPGREEEVAARIVNKQRAEHGETQAAQHDDKVGHSPDRNLPIPNYDQLNVDEITARLDALSPGDIQKLERYEHRHNNRKTLMEALDRRIEQAKNQ